MFLNTGNKEENKTPLTKPQPLLTLTLIKKNDRSVKSDHLNGTK